MSRYLVVAHQTAQSPELKEALQKRVQEDDTAEFTLLVPITYAGFLAYADNADDARVVARARYVGETAAGSLIEAGINVSRVIVGDELPLVALEEELQHHSGEYCEIIFSTLPVTLSRWVQLDQIRQSEEKFGVPVSHVVCAQSRYATSSLDATSSKSAAVFPRSPRNRHF